jgi:6-phosphogluconolactonase
VISGDMQVDVLPDATALARRGADWFLDIASNSRGKFAVALAGGSTPRGVYELLATHPYRDSFPWPLAHWFWGDERFVPHDDDRSNYRMVWDALLSHVPAPPQNIHPIPTENMTPEAAASAYEQALKAFYGAGSFDPVRPLFDICLLGLGEDGHFASLFPGTDVLKEGGRWVAPANGPGDEPRITLTYPALESSRYAAFLVSGSSKREILRRFSARDPALPASHFRPVGDLHLFCDAQAAGTTGAQGTA